MWRTALHDLVITGRFGTQGSLVSALAERGHAVTQSSVSRELKGMNYSEALDPQTLNLVAGAPGHELL